MQPGAALVMRQLEADHAGRRRCAAAASAGASCRRRTPIISAFEYVSGIIHKMFAANVRPSSTTSRQSTPVAGQDRADHRQLRRLAARQPGRRLPDRGQRRRRSAAALQRHDLGDAEPHHADQLGQQHRLRDRHAGQGHRPIRASGNARSAHTSPGAGTFAADARRQPDALDDRHRPRTASPGSPARPERRSSTAAACPTSANIAIAVLHRAEHDECLVSAAQCGRRRADDDPAVGRGDQGRQAAVLRDLVDRCRRRHRRQAGVHAPISARYCVHRHRPCQRRQLAPGGPLRYEPADGHERPHRDRRRSADRHRRRHPADSVARSPRAAPSSSSPPSPATSRPMWRAEVLDKREQPWTMCKWDEYGGVFVTWPGGMPGKHRCLVANAATGRLARFTGWDAMCFDPDARRHVFRHPERHHHAGRPHRLR